MIVKYTVRKGLFFFRSIIKLTIILEDIIKAVSILYTCYSTELHVCLNFHFNEKKNEIFRNRVILQTFALQFCSWKY